ncbi:hypothetical protein LX32DRAFT_638542 [Colletotrichum zoysiae]|uniref:Uncharacterized protein n=1 Tax=Colletotrichum zoysiae TaxID=1216348 RepID=A0AAD9M680_9PEZI|nr:hypothetical protein LX32DRAFT_638542 [Colletotrichum zoysiae]
MSSQRPVLAVGRCTHLSLSPPPLWGAANGLSGGPVHSALSTDMDTGQQLQTNITHVCHRRWAAISREAKPRRGKVPERPGTHPLRDSDEKRGRAEEFRFRSAQVFSWERP